MKIVIDIPEDIYEEWKLDGKYRTHSYAQRLILNGTPLPEQQPCEDCISRKEALRHGRLIYDDDGKGYVVVRVDEIIDLPSVTPTRPKGKWIHWTDDYKDYVTCSCCGYGEEGEVLLNDKTPFCSICGADMRGETE